MDVTVDDVLDAIEKNGLEQLFGHFFSDGKVDYNHKIGMKKIIKACAIGQASINLDINPFALIGGLNDAVPNLGKRIVMMNDNRKKSFKEIATYYRRALTKEQRAKVVFIK